MNSRRQYTQRRRSDTAAETRIRVIDAARRMVVNAPLHRLAMDDLAREAGVARSTVYAIFGGKRGLIQALADDLLGRGDFGAMQRALADPDPLKAVRGVFTVGTGLWVKDAPLVRQLIGLASVDPDVAAVVADLDNGRHAAMNILVESLVQARRIRSDLTVDQVRDLLWVLSSFSSFDNLVRGRGLRPAEAARRLVELASSVVA